VPSEICKELALLSHLLGDSGAQNLPFTSRNQRSANIAGTTNQFQKGLSLSDFMQQYGTETQCEAALIKARGRVAFTALAARGFGRRNSVGARC
jgi:hypothetical protein